MPTPTSGSEPTRETGPDKALAALGNIYLAHALNGRVKTGHLWAPQNRPFSGGPRLELRSTSRRSLLARCLPGALAVTPEALGRLDSLQYRQIQIADLFEQLCGRGPGKRFRQGVPPLPVLFLQCQERLHRVVPLLWPRSAVRWPTVPDPGFAGLAPLPVTCLPLRVRQRHTTMLHRYVTEPGKAVGRVIEAPAWRQTHRSVVIGIGVCVRVGLRQRARGKCSRARRGPCPVRSPGWVPSRTSELACPAGVPSRDGTAGMGPDVVIDDEPERAFRRATSRVPRKARLAHAAAVGTSGGGCCARVRQANWRRMAGESPAGGRSNQPPSPRVMRRSP